MTKIRPAKKSYFFLILFSATLFIITLVDFVRYNSGASAFSAFAIFFTFTIIFFNLKRNTIILSDSYLIIKKREIFYEDIIRVSFKHSFSYFNEGLFRIIIENANGSKACINLKLYDVDDVRELMLLFKSKSVMVDENSNFFTDKYLHK